MTVAFIIPLFPNSKKNGDTDILDRIYHATDVGENYNVGKNLGLSGILCNRWRHKRWYSFLQYLVTSRYNKTY